MSKRYNIRWKPDDNQELRRAVKNFNAKVDRLAKKNPQNKNALPQKITVKQIKELVITRQDLNRELNALRRFSKKGMEELITVPNSDYNLKITKWQKEEMTRRTGIINRKRNKRLKELLGTELQSRGEKLGYKQGELGMGKASEIELKPLRAFTPKMEYHDLKKKFKTILKESQSGYWNKRDIILVENYIKSLEENFNPKDIKDIVEQINNMDYNDFRKVFEAEGGNFELSYPPDDESYQNHLTALKSIWTPKNKPQPMLENKAKE